MKYRRLSAVLFASMLSFACSRYEDTTGNRARHAEPGNPGAEGKAAPEDEHDRPKGAPSAPGGTDAKSTPSNNH